DMIYAARNYHNYRKAQQLQDLEDALEDELDDGLDLEPTEEPERRKSGGQPGNQNARKHGFYAKFLTPEEQQDLQEAMELRGPAPEVAVLRVRLRALLNNPNAKQEHIISIVNSIGRLIRGRR
ncbi:MAG: hypothetical protein OXK21_08520, partial [Chloroflexota bacterium]|nr:hypothetical protein [Chloroflexota bacterium]